MKQFCILILFLSLTSIKTVACIPHGKLKISIESFISNYIDSLKTRGVNNYLSIIEMSHCAKNIESENYGFLIWHNDNSDKYNLLYLTNKCRKFKKKCPLEIKFLDYETNLLIEYKVMIDYFRKYEEDIKSEVLSEIIDDDGNKIVTNPYSYQKINIVDKGFQFFKIVELYKFYSQNNIESSNHLSNINSNLFTLYSLINEMKYKTRIYGKYIKARKIYAL